MSKNLEDDPRYVTDALAENSMMFRDRAAREKAAQADLWTKLYAANQIMLSAIAEGKVQNTLFEICSNLLGCEEIAIVEIDCATTSLRFLGEEGLRPASRHALIQNASPLLNLIRQGKPVIPADEATPGAALQALGVNALVPLWVNLDSKAAMLLFRLLPQKDGFNSEDREILQLLSIYAGPSWKIQTDA